MDLGANAYSTLVDAVKQGKVEESYVDRAVANVLRLKFKMGLFENPYVDPAQAKKLVNCAEHREVAREVAREGTILLKNEGVLPLGKEVRRVAELGSDVEMIYYLFGGLKDTQGRFKVGALVVWVREILDEGGGV